MAERKKLPPTHPGELLRKEIMPAAGLTQDRLATPRCIQVDDQ